VVSNESATSAEAVFIIFQSKFLRADSISARRLSV
jgi:hypothetical protein